MFSRKSKNQTETATVHNSFKWNLYHDSDVITLNDHIAVMPIAYESSVKVEDEIIINIKMEGYGWRSLTLPQHIKKIYPIVLQDKSPRIVIFGQFDKETGVADYTVASKQPQPIKATSIVKGVLGLHIFSTVGQMKRIIGRPFQTSSEIGKDVMETLSPRNFIGKKKLDESILDCMSDKEHKFRMKMCNITIIVSLISAIVLLGIYFATDRFIYAFMAYLPMLILITNLFKRLNLKHRKFHSWGAFISKLITFKIFKE
jgi:hypothetical protein